MLRPTAPAPPRERGPGGARSPSTLVCCRGAPRPRRGATSGWGAWGAPPSPPVSERPAELVGDVLEAGELGEEDELDRLDGSVALLADDHLGHVFLVGREVVLVDPGP